MIDEAKETIELSSGTIRYRDVGRGPVLLFVHGLLVSGSVWRKVIGPLSKRYRCIVPDWPLGSHRVAMRPDADLRPEGVARIVADFMDALDLRDVTLVGNDSGGAISQIVAARHGGRLARLILTTCDAFEIFPPPLFAYLGIVARVPPLVGLLGRALLWAPPLRYLPIAYGIVAKQRLPRDLLTSWIEPAVRDAGVRRDLTKFMLGVSPRVTLDVARELPRFDKPVLLVWTPEDRSFPLSLAHRLEQTFPDARIDLVNDSLVFVAEDRPDALIRSIERFVPAERAVATTATAG